MPVRSLSSSVLTWPSQATVDVAIRRWAKRIAESHPEIMRVGYFGSYARGDAGVGSDLDVLLVVRHTSDRIEHRGLGWDTTSLPVPVDLLVFTSEEFAAVDPSSRFGQVLQHEAVWISIR